MTSRAWKGKRLKLTHNIKPNAFTRPEAIALSWAASTDTLLAFAKSDLATILNSLCPGSGGLEPGAGKDEAGSRENWATLLRRLQLTPP